MTPTVTSDGSPVVTTVTSAIVTNNSSPASRLHNPDMQGFPHELKTMMFNYLSGQDALKVSGVCRDWRVLLNEDNLWNHFLARDFQHTETENPKELYRKFLRLNRNLSGGIPSTRTITASGPAELSCSKGSKLVLQLSNNNIQIWDLKTCLFEKTLPGSNFAIDWSFITILTLTDENKVIATDLTGTIMIWDLDSGVRERTFNSREFFIKCLCLASEKEILITGADDGKIMVWNLEDGTHKKTLFEDQTSITSLCLSQEGDLISGSSDNKIRILDIEMGNCKMTLEGHESEITLLRLTARGNLISGSADGTIKIWDLQEGICVTTLAGHQSRIISLCPTKTGKLISCDTSTIKIWDLQSDACEQTLVRSELLRSASFTDEGKLILSQSNGHVAILDFMADKEAPKSSTRCTLS